MMRRSNAPEPVLLRRACLAVAVAILLSGPAAASAQRGEPDSLMENGLAFLRAQQNEDGSFGSRVQSRLQTAMAALALLSSSSMPDAADVERIEKAASYLAGSSASGGSLGDKVFVTESHAASVLALICALDQIASAEPRSVVARKLTRSVKWLQRIQDRGSASQGRGGWKLGGSRGRANDRRATAWALFTLNAARMAGWQVKDGGFDRGFRYLMGSFKDKSKHPSPRQAGGFSVDAEGMAVESTSAMGGWALAQCGSDAGMVEQNQRWLALFRPGWTGPNYFYTNFFRVRALKFGDATGEEYRITMRRLRAQIADHTRADGAVGFPPGNAQNTVDMGPVLSTAFAVLILNVEDSCLFFDVDTRLKPLF